jgi:hypothetical protein
VQLGPSHRVYAIVVGVKRSVSALALAHSLRPARRSTGRRESAKGPGARSAAGAAQGESTMHGVLRLSTVDPPVIRVSVRARVTT